MKYFNFWFAERSLHHTIKVHRVCMTIIIIIINLTAGPERMARETEFVPVAREFPHVIKSLRSKRFIARTTVEAARFAAEF